MASSNNMSPSEPGSKKPQNEIRTGAGRRYLSIPELAEYIGITKGTLYVWVCKRMIPFYKLGKLVRFDVKEIDEWMNSKKVEEFS